ncbi:MAG: lipid-A-disaccharide synthase [Bacteroidetes bacterium]|nr:MAG: lipid-A-disaccharide synthase [Bacteroidota bacterium]
MKYFIIAGEASGDLHGAHLIAAIKQQDKDASFQFWGGDLMAEQTSGLRMHYKQITIMGFVEVLLNLRTIFNNIALCKAHIEAFAPDVVVLIDYPGFNLRIAEFCKKKGIKTVYYIAPKIWAWKENRGKKLEQFVDELLIIFPFEIPYFKKWKVKTTYVGNPLIDAITNYTYNTNFLTEQGITKPLIALLPGSRKQEIDKILPLMLEVVSQFPEYEFIIAGAPGLTKLHYEPYLNNQVKLVFGETYNLLKQAKAAIVCSGTATLETALFNVPQVCGYVANPISYHIAKWLVNIKYISLVNLCLDKPAILELIQHDFTAERMVVALKAVLPGGPHYPHMMADYQKLGELLGGEGASKLAAQRVVAMGHQKN